MVEMFEFMAMVAVIPGVVTLLDKTKQSDVVSALTAFLCIWCAFQLAGNAHHALVLRNQFQPVGFLIGATVMSLLLGFIPVELIARVRARSK